jgi:hypothetical protein
MILIICNNTSSITGPIIKNKEYFILEKKQSPQLFENCTCGIIPSSCEKILHIHKENVYLNCAEEDYFCITLNKEMSSAGPCVGGKLVGAD